MKEVALESVSRAPAFSDVAIRLGYLCLHARVAGLSGTAEQVEILGPVLQSHLFSTQTSFFPSHRITWVITTVLRFTLAVKTKL